MLLRIWQDNFFCDDKKCCVEILIIIFVVIGTRFGPKDSYNLYLYSQILFPFPPFFSSKFILLLFIVIASIFSLRAFGRSGYCDHQRRRCRRRCRRCCCRWCHTFVPRQNLRTVIGIDLLIFLNDWYE